MICTTLDRRGVPAGRLVQFSTGPGVQRLRALASVADKAD